MIDPEEVYELSHRIDKAFKECHGFLDRSDILALAILVGQKYLEEKYGYPLRINLNDPDRD